VVLAKLVRVVAEAAARTSRFAKAIAEAFVIPTSDGAEAPAPVVAAPAPNIAYILDGGNLRPRISREELIQFNLSHLKDRVGHHLMPLQTSVKSLRRGSGPTCNTVNAAWRAVGMAREGA
jgi:hypothetical protein